MDKEIVNIKKNGKLIAIEPGWQYFVLCDVLYSVASSGQHYNVWCGISHLNKYLHRLYQVTGRKYFTESKDMLIINKEFIKMFAYA